MSKRPEMNFHVFAIVWKSKDFRETHSYLKQNMNMVGKEMGEPGLSTLPRKPPLLASLHWPCLAIS